MNSTKSPKQTRITYICLNFYLPYSKLRTKQYHIYLFQIRFTIANVRLRQFGIIGGHFGNTPKQLFSIYRHGTAGSMDLYGDGPKFFKPVDQAYISGAY